MSERQAQPPHLRELPTPVQPQVHSPPPPALQMNEDSGRRGVRYCQPHRCVWFADPGASERFSLCFWSLTPAGDAVLTRAPMPESQCWCPGLSFHHVIAGVHRGPCNPPLECPGNVDSAAHHVTIVKNRFISPAMESGSCSQSS